MLTIAAATRYALVGVFMGAVGALLDSWWTPAPVVVLRGTIAPALVVSEADAWCWYYDSVPLRGRCYTREHASARME